MSFNLKGFLTNSLQKIYSNLNLESREVIIFGPWMGEVGPELQYWIPFICNLSSSEPLLSKRLLTVSRGGVETWYGTFPNEYVEIFDYLSEKEFKKLRNESFRINKLQKQINFVKGEQALIKRIARKKNINNYRVIHPSVMWKEIIPWLQEKTELNSILKKLLFRKFSSFDQKYVDFVDNLHLPEKFITVKFYDNVIFPLNKSNIQFVNEIIERINNKYKIVLLKTKYQLDLHDLFDIKRSSRIIDVSDKLLPESNLGIQTEILRRSAGFVGTNGGFSVLPAFLNKTCVSFYTKPLKNYIKLYHKHESVAERLYEQLNCYAYSAISTDSWKNLEDKIL